MCLSQSPECQAFKYIPPCLVIFVISKGILVLFYHVFMCVFSMKNSVYICTYTYVFKYLYESSEMLYVKQNGLPLACVLDITSSGLDGVSIEVS